VDDSTPPRYVTDRGIAIGRTNEFDRLVLHYKQPHTPFTANALREDRDLRRYEYDWWGYLGETGDYETVWNAYLDDLRYVLNDVAVLLENLNAGTVAISADHGEAFGEYCEYGHHIGSLHPKVRTVPWVETTATDEGTYTSSVDPPLANKTDSSVENILEALGYRK